MTQTKWPEVALGDISLSLQDGPFGSNLKSEHYVDDGVRVIRLQNIGSGAFIETDRAFIAPDHFDRLRKHECRAGDVLIATLGDPIVRACVQPPDLKIALNKADCLRMRCDPARAVPEYISGYLNSEDFQVRASALAHGQTRPRVNLRQIRSATIPLPPIEEQRRIAAVLDQADALRAKRREALAFLDTLTMSLFDTMFGTLPYPPVTVGLDLDAHPEGWRWELLTDVAHLATGHTPDREVPEYWAGDIPWISLTEIRDLDGRVAEGSRLRVSQQGIDNSSSVVLPEGTVCFSRTASLAFVTVMGRPMATSQDFVNWVCGDRLCPIYLMHALIRSRARLRALSTGSTHKTIYMRVAEQFRVLVPPLELQEAFAERVAAVAAERRRLERSAERLDELFASLQHRAFRGEL